MKNIYTLIEAHSVHSPNHIAIDTGKRKLTYEELVKDVNRIASSFNHLGICKGKKVGIFLPNGITFVESLLACQKLGVVSVLCNYRYNGDELLNMIKLGECDVLIYSESNKNTLEAIRSKLNFIEYMICDGENPSEKDHCSFSDLINAGNPEWTYKEKISDNDDAIYLFTGGTTGEPKAAIHTQESILLDVLLHSLCPNQYYSTDVFLNYSPLYHWGGLHTLLCILSVGATFIILDKFNPQVILNNIREKKATHIFLIPSTLCNDIHDLPGYKSEYTESIRRVALGGSTSTLENIKQVFETFPNAEITNGYGLTENVVQTYMNITKDIIENRPDLLSSIGVPATLSEIKLIGEDGKEVSYGEVGEAYAKSAFQFKGYINHEDPFVDGWLPTGDLLRKNKDGYYFFVDRKKDMIKCGGENIYSFEVEQAFSTHPSVKCCSVVGMPDDHYVEIVIIAVILNEGYSVTKMELLEYCKKHIASYKKPSKIIFLTEDFPRTTVGKVDKKRLRMMLQDKINEKGC
jgi:acyl-CoA synthetase (AMP-forming)/AMP-acid ligase II